MPFEDLLITPGQDNMPGLKQKAYFAFESDIETFPTISKTPVTAADRVRLSGTYVMKATKNFKQCYISKGKGSAKSEVQGEVDCHSFNNTAKVFYPCTNENARAAAADLKNANVIVILIEPDGTRIVYGDKDLACTVKPSVNYGESVTGEKGVTFEFQGDSNVPGYTYNGAIPLSSGSEPAIS